MTNDRFPRSPLVPTIPAPADEDHKRLMRELRAALANCGELMTRLDTTLAVHELAILTEEHKANHAHERIDEEARARLELTERVAALEEAQAAE